MTPQLKSILCLVIFLVVLFNGGFLMALLSIPAMVGLLLFLSYQREANLSQVKVDINSRKLKKQDYETNGQELKLKLAISENSERQSYETYQSVVLSEVKRLDGQSEDEIHWSEVYDDEGTKRAFDDGVDPKTLAAIIAKRGIPKPDPQMVSGLLENDSEFRALKKLAMQGDADAQSNLGLIYLGGIGAPLNSGEAVKWFRLAANQGKPAAQFTLGMLFLDGQFVPQDLVQAHFLVSLAAVGFQVSDAELSKSAFEQRGNISVRMTPEQIVEAERLAREWVAAHPNK